MKPQKDTKKMKRDALMSFLETTATQNPTTEPVPEKALEPEKTQQDCEQVYLDQNNNCSVCSAEIDITKMKKCGFCNLVTCGEHMRKRRRKKGKFQRICDNCQDRVMYQTYMKLEAKAEESLCVEEEIIILKHQNFFKEVSERREKRSEIAFATMKIQENQNEHNKEYAEKERKLAQQENKVQSFELSVKQLQFFVTRAQSSFRQNHEQDWNILSQENSRLAKELAKIEKKCLEIRTAMEKKEKQIEQAFLNWEQRQFKKKLETEERQAASKKKEGCQIY